jgi:glycosyltransferase involved in cell wall biosynthesis
MKNINIFGCVDESTQTSMQIKRSYDASSRASDRQWARTTQHIFNGNFIQTMLLRDTLTRKFPDAVVKLHDITEIRRKEILKAIEWKPRLTADDVAVYVLGKHYAQQETARLSEYADPKRTIIVCVDEWLIYEIAKNPELIPELNKYAAVFDHSALSVEKLRKAGLKKVRFMPTYRIHDEAAKRKADSLTTDGLNTAVTYSAVGSVVGTDIAVDAVKLANQKLAKPIKLDIYGPCSEAEGDDRLQWLSSIIDGDPNIEYKGELDSDTDIAALAEADLGLYLPAQSTDNVPTAVVAMLGAGLPLIVGGYRFAPEAVKEGKNGYIVLPNDAQAAADAIVQLADSPDTLRRFTRNSRALHKAVFSEDAATAELVSVIQKLQ